MRLKKFRNCWIRTVDLDSKVVWAEFDESEDCIKNKPKAAIAWLSSGVEKKSKFYGSLFIGGEINKNSTIEKNVLVGNELKLNEIYEFESVGYFYVDINGMLHHLAWLNHHSCEGGSLLL